MIVTSGVFRGLIFSGGRWVVLCPVAAEPEGDREGISPTFQPLPIFLTWGIFISGVKMPKVGQIFKIKWYRWPHIALFHA